MTATSDITPITDADPVADRAELVRLTAVKKALDAELRNIKDQLATVTDRVLEHFTDQGIDSIKDSASGKTIYLNRRIWARANGDKPAACAALRAHPDLAPYVEETFNTNSLSAYFREEAKRLAAETGAPVTDLDALLPDDLREVIALSEDHVVGIRG